jgi:hypothetical protein
MRRNDALLSRLASRIAVLLALLPGVGGGSPQTRNGEAEPVHRDTRFEPHDVNAKAVFLTGAGLLAAVWVTVLLMNPLFNYYRHLWAVQQVSPLPAAAHGNPVPPEPRIQENPRRDLRDFRAYEDSQLNAYHWVDRSKGVVSIPIAQAIKLVAQRGIPPQSGPAGMTYFDPHAGTRLTGFEGKAEPEPR